MNTTLDYLASLKGKQVTVKLINSYGFSSSFIKDCKRLKFTLEEVSFDTNRVYCKIVNKDVSTGLGFYTLTLRIENNVTENNVLFYPAFFKTIFI